VAALAATYRALPLSRLSYALVFLFLCLHTAAVNARYRRDFAREFIDSLRVKDPHPHGEETLRRLTGG
jgi:uncharacterized membrane protein YjdF